MNSPFPIPNSQFSRYPKYKDSGVNWLGQVPEHWEVAVGRRLFQQKREPALENDEQLSATQKYGVVPQKLFMEMQDQKVTLALSGTGNFKHVEAGDFVISLRSFQGGIERSEYSGCVSPAYTVLRPASSVEGGLWRYLLKSKGYIEALQSVTEGIRDGKNISFEQFGEIGVPIIPPAEQTAIAAFLDRETAKIDALVAEQQRLMGLLKEKRQAVISAAVTRGIVNEEFGVRNDHLSTPSHSTFTTHNSKFIPSGIEWLGDVPAHWETRTISKASTKITNGFVGPTREILFETGIPYIQATHIKGGRINFGNEYFVTLEWSNAHAKSILAEEDVLIVQTGAGTGDVGLVSKNEVGFNCHALIIVAPNKTILRGTFLSAVLQSTYGQQKLASIQTGAMHPHLNCGEVKFVEVPLPPIAEQADIVAYIRDAADQLDTLTAEAQRAIDLLQERRTALISAAVTGQIDVRNHANQ